MAERLSPEEVQIWEDLRFARRNYEINLMMMRLKSDKTRAAFEKLEDRGLVPVDRESVSDVWAKRMAACIGNSNEEDFYKIANELPLSAVVLSDWYIKKSGGQKDELSVRGVEWCKKLKEKVLGAVTARMNSISEDEIVNNTTEDMSALESLTWKAVSEGKGLVDVLVEQKAGICVPNDRRDVDAAVQSEFYGQVFCGDKNAANNLNELKSKWPWSFMQMVIDVRNMLEERHVERIDKKLESIPGAVKMVRVHESFSTYLDKRSL